MGVYINGKWHEELADPETGGEDTGSGRNFSSGEQYNAVSDQLTAANAWGENLNTRFGSGTSTQDALGQVAAVANSGAGGQQVAAAIDKMLQAIADGNKQAFEETVREWNLVFGLDTQKFQDDVRRFNENLAISQAGLTGTYQGQQTQQAALQAANIAAQRAATAQNWAQIYGYTPQLDANGNPVTVIANGVPAQTLAAQLQAAEQLGMYQGQQTLAAQQQQYAQQLGLINQAAQLQANPFRQQQAIGQMSRLLGGQGVAGFSAPNTVQGVGVAGGNTQGGMGYLQQMIDDIRDPTANSASMNQVLQGIPTPNKVNSVEFMRAAPSTQNLVLQGMTEKYGLDPQDALAQIKATLPGFQAPSAFGSVKR